MSDSADLRGPPSGLPPRQTAEEFEAEVVRLMGSPVASKLGGRFVHDFVGVKPTRNWLLKGALLASTFFLIVGEPGCIAGDARMYYQVRDANGRKRTDKTCSLEQLYYKFHRAKYLGHGRGKSVGRLLPPGDTIWLASVDDEGRVFRNKVLDVIDSGQKGCWRVTLSDGREIKATPDHKFMTEVGYSPLSDLRVGDAVLAHGHRVENLNKGSGKAGQRKFFYVRNHPAARTKVIDGRFTYKVLPAARATVEASWNGYTLDAYLALLNSDADLSHLRTLGRWDNVHHKNEDFQDDRLENLEVIPHADHALEHARGSLRFIASPSRIVSIEPAGKMRTFDITMDAPYANFIASDFVVHNCGKSFLTLDLVMTMALAAVDPRAPREWFGRRIKPCGVIYIAAEGQDDFIIRMHAWFMAKGLPVETRLPLYLIPTAVDLRSSDAHTKVLIEEIKAVQAVMRAEFGCEAELVIVDTLNRALAGGDDSKPEHVGALIKNCGVIREASKVAVGAVHHTAKNSGRQDPRGHGSLRGDNDAEIFVNPARDGAPNDWRIARNKAGPTGDRHEFRLRPIEVGRDDDHDPITSCYVAPGAMEASTEATEMRDAADAAKTGKPTMTADGRAILPARMTIVMRALHEAINDKGEYPPPDVRVPHGRRAIKFAAWTDELIARMPGDEKASKGFKDRCRKMRDEGAERLVNRGLIQMDGDWVWRTAKRVAGIDRPERDDTKEPPPLPPGLEGEDLSNVPF